MKNKKWIRKILIIVGWLFVWQLVSLLAGNRILLVGPAETLAALVRLMVRLEFWGACLGTLFRILLGFGAGLLLGVLLAVGSARYSWLEELLAPVMTLIKAIPVASFVVIFLIWWGSAQLATVISFCIVLPNLYINTLEGIKSTDSRLLEMARVFDIPFYNKMFYIYRPALKPFLDSAIRLAAGMSWKSGVAAEVIGLPEHAIGEQLYMSKIYLDTAGVLAWTLVTILLSTGFEKLIMYLWGQFCVWEPVCKEKKQQHGAYRCVNVRREAEGRYGTESVTACECEVQLKEIVKSYHEKVVLDKVSAVYQAGQVYHFNSPSGSGKTTLFRLLAGLEQPDNGKVERKLRDVAFLFQEDRLCEEYSALKNVELVTGNVELARKHLLQVLDAEDINKPCRELSGGMKRRVAIARTMAAGADLLLLDEPYNGLDEANRTRVYDYIRKYSRESIVLIASHIE